MKAPRGIAILALATIALGLAAPSLQAAPGEDGPSSCDAVQPEPVGSDPYFAVHENVDYTGTSVTAHCGQRYNLFVPFGPAPAEGWPCLIVLDYTGFTRSRRRDTLSSTQANDRIGAIALEALDNGIAVVYASATVSRGGSSSNQVSDTEYDPWATDPGFPTGQHGAAYAGNGVFLPPGALPADYTGTIPPYADPARPMAEKDAVMLIQHVKFHGASGLPPGADEGTSVPIDLDKIAVSGNSAGAIAFAWCALGPDRAAQTFPNAQPGTQEATQTRVRAALLQTGVLDFPHLVPTTNGVHFPKLNAGVHDYDEPSATLSETNSVYPKRDSALRYGTDDGAVSAANADLALHLTYQNPSSLPEPVNFDPASGATGPATPCGAYNPYVEGTETDINSSWPGHAWKSEFPDSYLLATADAAYDAEGCLDGSVLTNLPNQVVPAATPQSILATAQILWLLNEFDGPWTHLGGGTPGVNGTPLLLGTGSLEGGTPFSLVLTQGPPSALTLLWIAPTSTPVNILGGTIHAFPFSDQIILPTDAGGGIVAGATWPTGVPSLTNVWFQYILQDGASAYGITLSNGLRATTP